jgi:hypothetical protein
MGKLGEIRLKPTQLTQVIQECEESQQLDRALEAIILILIQTILVITSAKRLLNMRPRFSKNLVSVVKTPKISNFNLKQSNLSQVLKLQQ